MEEIKVCPFCKENDVIISNDTYHCNSCDRDFDEDDYNHEILRQKISCVCSGEYATEDSPIIVDNGTMIKIFQDEEGILWAVEDNKEPIEVDTLETSTLQEIFDFLEKKYGVVVATDFFWAYYKN